MKRKICLKNSILQIDHNINNKLKYIIFIRMNKEAIKKWTAEPTAPITFTDELWKFKPLKPDSPDDKLFQRMYNKANLNLF